MVFGSRDDGHSLSLHRSRALGEHRNAFGVHLPEADGIKSATIAPDFPLSGQYRVYVAWGPGSDRRGPIAYHVHHAYGQETFLIDQSSSANSWVRLGKGAFQFNENSGGSVVITNEAVDIIGSMYVAAVQFEIVDPWTWNLWSAY